MDTCGLTPNDALQPTPGRALRLPRTLTTFHVHRPGVAEL